MSGDALLVDIAMLMDFRLGAAGLISAQFAFDLSDSSSYYHRSSDELFSLKWGKLSKTTLDGVTKKYLQEILQVSPMTAYVGFLREMLILQSQLAIASPIQPISRLDINTYPYRLTNEDSQSLAQAISYHLYPHRLDISVMYIEPKALNGTAVSNRYMAMAVYNPVQWIESNKEDFLAGQYRDITLYTPRINHARDITDEEKQQLSSYGELDLFLILRDSMKTYVRVEYVEVCAVCANTPINPKHTFKEIKA